MHAADEGAETNKQIGPAGVAVVELLGERETSEELDSRLE